MLITYENYKKSVKSYLEVKLNTEDKNKSAIANNDGTFFFTENEPEDCFYLNWARTTAEKGIDITDLHIKSNYLTQLRVIEMQENIKESDIDVARLSANISSVVIKVDDFKSIINQTVESCFTNQEHMGELIASNHISKYGVHGAVAIKLQNPTAQLLFSTTELSSLGIKISPQQKPIHILTAVDKPFFIRGDGEPVSLSHATRDEQVAISEKKIEVEHSVVYKSQMLFDVSQLELSKKQQQQLLVNFRPKVADFSELVELAKTLRIKTEEKPIIGTAIKGYYDSEKRLAVISSDLSDTQKVSEYIGIISEAVVKDTSPSSPSFQELERNIVSLNLHARYSLSPPNELVNSISTAFVNAVKVNPTFPIEKTFARTTGMTRHLSKQLDTILSLRENLQEQKQNITKNQAPQIQSEELNSFIQGI